MRLVSFSIRRRVTVSMVAIALVVFGLVAFGRLPVQLFPDVAYPTLTVETELPGAAPAEVETLVTRPIEEAVGIVGGVERMTSSSQPGLSRVTLEFGWDRDMDFAAIDVREKLDRTPLPDDSGKPTVLRFDPNDEPVMRLYLTGGESLFELRYLAEEVLEKHLESTPGLAAVRIGGGFEDEIQIRIDQGKLARLGLGIDEVIERLRLENVNRAGGSLYESEARYLVRARNEFQDLDDIRDTILISRDGRTVSVADVATVGHGHKERESIIRFGGAEAVELALFKEGDANVVSVARSIEARLRSAKDLLPEGISVTSGIDRSHFIRASIREVTNNAIIGGLLALFVLLLFLKQPRSAIIISIAIPVSIITTFFLMYRTGTSLNIMSLGGLALGVGMLVDNAIVVLESIHKQRERGSGPIQSADVGASTVGRAVVASTLTTVAVFVPVVFLEGVASQLFVDQALTVSFSLLASLAVALTLIPMLAAKLSEGGTPSTGADPAPSTRRGKAAHWVLVRLPALTIGATRRGLHLLGRGLAYLARPLTWAFDRAFGAISDGYPHVLRWALRHRLTVACVAVVGFGASLMLGARLGVDLIPTFAQGQMTFVVELPSGTPLEVTDRELAEAQAELRDEDRVASYSSVAGGSTTGWSGVGTSGENIGRIHVRMAPGSRQADEDGVVAILRDALERIPRARITLERPTYFTFRTPIEVELYGSDVETLHRAAVGFRDTLAGVEGMVDVATDVEMGTPELQVRFDRERLSRLGLDLDTVTRRLRSKIQGTVPTRFMTATRDVDIRVRAEGGERLPASDLAGLVVAQRDGVPITLSMVADVGREAGPSEIRRIGQRRAVVVGGNLSGRDVASAGAEVRELIDAHEWPAGVRAVLSGQEEEMRQSMRSLLFALALAIFLVYLVMASQFESFLHPFVVILTVPLGATGAILALAVTGETISVVAMIGAVMLAGIVVNNAIVLIDAINQLRREGRPKLEAMIEGAQSRLRPIVMTSATTILALLPMALGLGEGAELRAPMAITVIGGLLLATLLTLIVLPAIYAMVDREKLSLAEETAPGDVGAAAGEVIP
jgi:HAE1 family hydrophobic/amphiphilic exporter-1